MDPEEKVSGEVPPQEEPQKPQEPQELLRGPKTEEASELTYVYLCNEIMRDLTSFIFQTTGKDRFSRSIWVNVLYRWLRERFWSL